MSIQRHDLRTQSPQKYGKPTITYPYGDTRFPRIVEMRTAKKGTDSAQLIPYLTPHRDQASFPGAVLVEQTADSGDDTDKNITETYDTLPGPIFYDIVPDAELGIPMMTTVQRRATTDVWTCGEIAPIALPILGATVGSQTVLTLGGNGGGGAPYPSIPDIYQQEWVVISGSTNTTPSLDGIWQVVAVNGNQITLNLAITGVSGAVAGNCQRYSYAYVERHKTENLSVVQMATTRAVTGNITQYDQSTLAYRSYPFPDALVEIIEYSSDASTTNITDPLSYAYSWSGGVGFQILPGFRGTCQATRLWVFSMGPPTALPIYPRTGLPYAPTVVIPAVGTVTVQGGSKSQSFGTSGGALAFTVSTSNSYKGVTIPPVLTMGYSVNTTDATGAAGFKVDLPPSIVKDAGSGARTGFTQGDIITDIQPVKKLRGGAIYMTEIWLIVVPYTTGVGPS